MIKLYLISNGNYVILSPGDAVMGDTEVVYKHLSSLEVPKPDILAMLNELQQDEKTA